MKELSETGLIQAERRAVTILDREGLEKRAAPGPGARAGKARAALAGEAMLRDHAPSGGPHGLPTEAVAIDADDDAARPGA
jgi:hypothetical protein